MSEEKRRAAPGMGSAFELWKLQRRAAEAQAEVGEAVDPELKHRIEEEARRGAGKSGKSLFNR